MRSTGRRTLLPVILASLILLSGCASSTSNAPTDTMLNAPTAQPTVASESGCTTLGVSIGDLTKATGLDLTREQPVVLHASARNGGSCIYASRYKNHDVVGLTGLDDTGQDLSTAVDGFYSDDEKSHGGCEWDSAGSAFHCNPLAGNPIPAYTVVVATPTHLWNAEIWATTQEKLDAARAGIEALLAER